MLRTASKTRSSEPRVIRLCQCQRGRRCRCRAPVHACETRCRQAYSTVPGRQHPSQAHLGSANAQRPWVSSVAKTSTSDGRAGSEIAAAPWLSSETPLGHHRGVACHRVLLACLIRSRGLAAGWCTSSEAGRGGCGIERFLGADRWRSRPFLGCGLGVSGQVRIAPRTKRAENPYAVGLTAPWPGRGD